MKAPRLPSTLSPKPAAPGNRESILKAAAALFCRQGFHGTSTRDIARKAKVSLGNIYNHFRTKEDIFTTLLAEYESRYFSPDQPLARAIASGRFPDNIEPIAAAVSTMVGDFSDYILLIYVDVVEFKARHITRLFQNMRQRCALSIRSGRVAPMAPGVDPTAALMFVLWSYFNYFTMEKVFRVKGHYGMEDKDVIRFFANVFRSGMLPGRHPNTRPTEEACK